MSGRRKPWPRLKPHSSAKVPERSPETLRLYTIPPSAPFLTTLAKAILDGALPSPGGSKPDPLTLPLTTIYLPTRRAGPRAARGVSRRSQRRGTALAAHQGARRSRRGCRTHLRGRGVIRGRRAPSRRPPSAPCSRRLALMRLVLVFGQRMRTEAFAERGDASSSRPSR